MPLTSIRRVSPQLGTAKPKRRRSAEKAEISRSRDIVNVSVDFVSVMPRTAVTVTDTVAAPRLRDAKRAPAWNVSGAGTGDHQHAEEAHITAHPARRADALFGAKLGGQRRKQRRREIDRVALASGIMLNAMIRNIAKWLAEIRACDRAGRCVWNTASPPRQDEQRAGDERDALAAGVNSTSPNG